MQTFTFTVVGPLSEFGVWHAGRDVTEFLSGGHDGPVTIPEIEELVAVWQPSSSVEWVGLTGSYTDTVIGDDDEIETYDYVITLTPVPRS